MAASSAVIASTSSPCLLVAPAHPGAYGVRPGVGRTPPGPGFGAHGKAHGLEPGGEHRQAGDAFGHEA